MLDNVSLLLTLASIAEQAQHLVPMLVQTDPTSIPFGLDLSIESLGRRKYSIGIFGFLIFSIFFFAIIILIYLPKGSKKLKKGEKIMFGAIILGIVFAVFVGWLQLIEGYLI